MELLLSLVIIHEQMFRINFFFVSFFSHFFLLWPLAMLCILISWIWTNFSSYLASTTAFSKFFTVKIVFRYLIGSKWRLLYNKRVNNCQNGFFKHHINFDKLFRARSLRPQDKSERTEKDSNRKQILLPTKDTPKTLQRSCPCRFLHWKSIWEPSWIFSSRYYQLMNSGLINAISRFKRGGRFPRSCHGYFHRGSVHYCWSFPVPRMLAHGERYLQIILPREVGGEAEILSS